MTMEGFVVDDSLYKVRVLIMKGIAVLLVIGSLFGGCSYLNYRLGLKDDHPIEEFIEDTVEFHLGLEKDSLDFSGDKDE